MLTLIHLPADVLLVGLMTFTPSSTAPLVGFHEYPPVVPTTANLFSVESSMLRSAAIVETTNQPNDVPITTLSVPQGVQQSFAAGSVADTTFLVRLYPSTGKPQ